MISQNETYQITTASNCMLHINIISRDGFSQFILQNKNKFLVYEYAKQQHITNVVKCNWQTQTVRTEKADSHKP